jgi:hypothetical protein
MLLLLWLKANAKATADPGLVKDLDLAVTREACLVVELLFDC